MKLYQMFFISMVIAAVGNLLFFVLLFAGMTALFALLDFLD